MDARSDIFSFGALLYEMVTGARAFAGTSTADTLSAVIRAQPKAPTAIVATVPSDLEKVILRCLRKDPRAAVPAHRRREGGAAGHQGGVGIGRDGARPGRAQLVADRSRR